MQLSVSPRPGVPSLPEKGKKKQTQQNRDKTPANTCAAQKPPSWATLIARAHGITAKIARLQVVVTCIPHRKASNNAQNITGIGLRLLKSCDELPAVRSICRKASSLPGVWNCLSSAMHGCEFVAPFPYHIDHNKARHRGFGHDEDMEGA